MLPFNIMLGLIVAATPLLLTLVFLIARFRSVTMAVPRWVARWIIIWPYSWGILKGLVAPIPPGAVPNRPSETDKAASA